MLKNLLALIFVAVDGGAGSEGTPESASPENTPTDTGQPEELNKEEAPKEEPKEQEVPKYNIDGEEYDLDTIKQWKQGHLRQSDYTKKTQEVAAIRKELEAERAKSQDAQDIYNFLQENPHIAQQLYDTSTKEGTEVPKVQQKSPYEDPRVDKVMYELELQKVESKLNEIMKNDPDVDDVELLNLANERDLDLETAYTLWKGQNVDKIVKKKQSELQKKLQANANATGTMINSTDKGVTKGLGLTEREVAMAKRLDMPMDEYAKWKTYDPNR